MHSATFMHSAAWKLWVSHPQQLPVRKIMFALHKWLGLLLAIYVLAMSLSGLALLFYPQLYRSFDAAPQVVGHGRLLTSQELDEAVHRAYPEAQISWMWKGASEFSAVEIWLSDRGSESKRFFDPVTGADLGSSSSAAVMALNTLAGLHRNLLFEEHGKALQFAGGLCVVLVSLTGAIVWWPGVSRWLRHLRVRRSASASRKVWETHSATGFWSCWALLLMGFTGSALAIQDRNLISTLWMGRFYRLHSGQFLGDAAKQAVLILLAIAILTVIGTGAGVSFQRWRISRRKTAQRLRTNASAIWPAHRLQTDHKPAFSFLRHR